MRVNFVLNIMVLAFILMPLTAMAQINSDSSDLVFTSSGSEILRMTTSRTLDISGSIKIKNNTGTCNGAREGILRYNDSNNFLELCNGTMWRKLLVNP